MTSSAAPVVGGVDLLERAMGYTLGSLHLVTTEAMSRPTPCRDWDLRALLRHMNDSLKTLHESIDLGHLDVTAWDFGDPETSPVTTLRNRACSMLGAWTNANADDRRSIRVAGVEVPPFVVAATGALEIAVHGWDVAEAMGQPRPVPHALAETLLPMARTLVDDVDRPGRFDSPVEVSPMAHPGARLVAFLGRAPA